MVEKSSEASCQVLTDRVSSLATGTIMEAAMTRTSRAMANAVLAVIAILVIAVASFVIAPPSASAYAFTGCRSSRIAGNYAEYFRTGVGINT